MLTKSAKTLNFKGFAAWDDKTRTLLKTVARAGGVKDASRVRTGYASVFGVLDSHSDVVLPGAFQKAIEEFQAGQSRCKYLWSHDGALPPIAKIIDISELSAGEMPNLLKLSAIETGAAGCLKVVREYLKTPRADEALQCLDACSMELSFGFSLSSNDYEYQTIGGQQIRLIKNITFLGDISDVVWGSNPATLNDSLNAAKRASVSQSASKDAFLQQARLKMQKLQLLSAGIAV